MGTFSASLCVVSSFLEQDARRTYDLCMSLTPEEIEENWNQYRSFVERLSSLTTEDRAKAALDMVDTLGERLATAPASSRKEYHNAFPGGLVEHSIHVLGNAMKIVKTFEWKVPKDSLIIGCLFHDLGKVGDLENDLYLPQTEEWRATKNGEFYMFNKNMTFMTVPLRGLFLCQHFGLRLTQDEMLAIFLNDGQIAKENAPYCLKEPLLADIVHMADVVATKQEKGSVS